MRSAGRAPTGRGRDSTAKSDLGARAVFGALGGAVAGLLFAVLGVLGVAMKGNSSESRLIWQIPTALFSAAVLSGGVAGLLSGRVRGMLTKMIAGGVCGVVFALTAAMPYTGAPWSWVREDGIAAASSGLVLGMILALLIKDEEPK